MTFPLAEVGYAEATWVLVVKSLVIFLGVFLIVPVLTRPVSPRAMNRLTDLADNDADANERDAARGVLHDIIDQPQV